MALLAVGCASTPPPMLAPLPGGLAETHARTRPATMDANVRNAPHVYQFIDPQREIVYFQTFGGGGATLGVALGPLGVLANMGMIESATKEDMKLLAGKVALQPGVLFAEAAQAAGVAREASPAVGKARLAPYLYVSKTESGSLILASALEAGAEVDSKPWRGVYMVQLATTYTVAGLSTLRAADLDRLRDEVRDGYAQILKLLRSDSAARIAQERPVLYESRFLMPRFSYEAHGSLVEDTGDLVWIRNPGGVYGVRKGASLSLKFPPGK